MRDPRDIQSLERERGRTADPGRRERPYAAFFETTGRGDPRRRGSSTSGRPRGRPGERHPDFGPDAYREGLARDETRSLIASDKVEGTPIYDRNGRKLGAVRNLMLDKTTGEVAYAVVRHGSGFLGLDERHFPLDWRDLTYDRRVQGYGVEFTEEDLERQLRRVDHERSARAERYEDHDTPYRPRFYW